VSGDEPRPWLPDWLGVALMVLAIPTVLLHIAEVIEFPQGTATVYLLTVAAAAAVWLGGPRLIVAVQTRRADRAEGEELAE
jgi:hypothetical protein